MAYYTVQQGVCPCCGSQDIDEERSECRACHTGLPTGSYDRVQRSRMNNATRRRYVNAMKGRGDLRTEPTRGSSQF